mgnify:CR=1 FL=1
MILVKATQGVGIPRLLSGRKLPVPSMSFTPTIPKWDCFLAKAIKKRLKAEKIDKGIKVVFSSEIQDQSSLKTTDGSNYKKSFYGTNSYMPGLFGLYAAETVIRNLLKKE